MDKRINQQMGKHTGQYMDKRIDNVWTSAGSTVKT